MPLVFNGISIPENTPNVMEHNSTDITKIIYDGLTVWEQFLYTSPKEVSASVTLISGVDFPSDTLVTLCMIGGGAGSAKCFNQTVKGGLAGDIVSTQVTTPAQGTEVIITIGDGGNGVGLNTATNAGTATIAFGLTAAGGANSGYSGDSGTNVNCAGTFTDGSYQVHSTTGATHRMYGGQSGFSDGGTSFDDSPHSPDKGSGGGAKYTNLTQGGNGGNGYVIISWN